MAGFDTKKDTPLVVSTGAGIAIAGVWMAAAAVTITLLYFSFGPTAAQTIDESKVTTTGALILIFLIAAPMIAAYSITKMILSKD